eukprot:GHVT01082864.1.p1 GENE.GHVT01082864.1~~GHVT01082864.1.p1  ORF type:complete len:109 (+),score=10.66 GHVT01082864.1:560-886(+)
MIVCALFLALLLIIVGEKEVKRKLGRILTTAKPWVEPRAGQPILECEFQIDLPLLKKKIWLATVGVGVHHIPDTAVATEREQVDYTRTKNQTMAINLVQLATCTIPRQ